MEAQTLGAEDYAALQSMLVSDDAKVRSEGQGLAKKLNAAEQVDFFNFQKQSRKGRDEQSQRADSAMVGGVPVVGSVNPEDALMAGVAGRAIKGAASAVPNVGGKVVAGAKAAAEIASPAVKYEITRRTLQAVGVPGPLATGVAIAVSGYRRSGAPSPAPAAAAEEATVAARPAPAPAAPAESPIDLTRRLKADNAARAAAPSETVAGGTPPPSDPLPSPAPAAPPKSPQQVLNEEALARRRAEYQARAAAEAEAAASAPAKAKMTAVESKEYMRLRALGKTDEQAKEAILASRAMNAQFGLSVPTDAQTQFPKGMRGKPRTDR